ncbi:hypothetical protein EGI22_17560 [Lacihabitans sp. LS3-19]|uniref:hypothetical protein n=1 Tax=Lacihabitans sp. LS3-19 TaxID=2487335 RepID=UPI0020CDDE30|nr:hypothetical protein [Lacihabitans sp. LS3-19]MCP9769714.1 hypothetical protein [Lacihabitans sp. LS3-19]
MKNLISSISLFILISTNIAFSQVNYGGHTLALVGTGTSTSFEDNGSNIFWVDTWAGPGGTKTIFRRDNYWYIVYTGLGITYYANTYYLYRTEVEHPTINPPACALWQQYVVPFGPYGYQWYSYPSLPIASPNGPIVSLTLTGPSASTTALGSTTTVINPDYIDLANKNSVQIAIIPNSAGRILYNTCEESIQFNNGTNWKSVWPNYSDYNLNQNQVFNFGDASTQIFGTNNNGGTTHLVFKTDGVERLVLGKNNSPYTTNFTVKTAIATPVTNTTGDYTLGEDNHIVIHSGTSSNTFTLPNPNPLNGREYKIANPSTGTVTFSPYSIIGLSGGILSAGQNLTIVSDGYNWYKIN